MKNPFRSWTANGKKQISYELEAQLGVEASEKQKGREKLKPDPEYKPDLGNMLKDVGTVKSANLIEGIDIRVTDSGGAVHEHYDLDQEHAHIRLMEYLPPRDALTDIVNHERYSNNATVRYHYHLRRGILADHQPESGEPAFEGDLVAEAYVDFIRKAKSNGTRRIKKP